MLPWQGLQFRKPPHTSVIKMLVPTTLRWHCNDLLLSAAGSQSAGGDLHYSAASSNHPPHWQVLVWRTPQGARTTDESRPEDERTAGPELQLMCTYTARQHRILSAGDTSTHTLVIVVCVGLINCYFTIQLRFSFIFKIWQKLLVIDRNPFIIYDCVTWITKCGFVYNIKPSTQWQTIYYSLNMDYIIWWTITYHL